MSDRLSKLLAAAAKPGRMDKLLDDACAQAAALPKQASLTDQPAQTEFVNEPVKTLLAAQIGKELKGQYEYLAMGAFFKKVGLDGFANYFMKQAGEEATHAAKIIDYLMEAGVDFAMPAVPAPEAGYTTARQAAERYLSLEKGITADWLAIFQAADKTADYAVIKLAQWFVDEQIQEEDAAVTFYQKVAIAGEGAGLLILDCDHAKR